MTLLIPTALTFLVCALPTRAGEERTPQAIIDRALKAGGGTEKIQQY
jgi:hypothetical protein